MPSRRAYNAKQTAKYLGISVDKLRRWSYHGIGPKFLKEGRLKLYFIDDVEDFLHENMLVPRHPDAATPPKPTREARPLTDEEWWHIAPILQKHGDDCRHFIDAVLYILWTNRPWHMLPLEYGKHRRVLERFTAWGKQGTWELVIGALSVFPDFPYRFIKRDSICVANLHATGRQQVVTHFLDTDQQTIGEYKVPFRTQRRLKERKWPTIAEHMEPSRQAALAAQFKGHRR